MLKWKKNTGTIDDYYCCKLLRARLIMIITKHTSPQETCTWYSWTVDTIGGEAKTLKEAKQACIRKATSIIEENIVEIEDTLDMYNDSLKQLKSSLTEEQIALSESTKKPQTPTHQWSPPPNTESPELGCGPLGAFNDVMVENTVESTAPRKPTKKAEPETKPEKKPFWLKDNILQFIPYFFPL